MLRRRSRNETPSLVPTASPSKITSPSSGSINRINNRAVVDLPQPLSPTTPNVSPFAIVNEMSSTACTRPDELKRAPFTVKYFFSPRTTSNG